MATMIGYIYNQFTGHDLSVVNMAIICVVFTIVTGYIAYRGMTGSTLTAIGINIIQLGTLVIFSGLAVWYRIANPAARRAVGAFRRPSIWSRPHMLSGILVQSTIAILILVGFESCTALSAETKNAGKNIPKAIIISLVVQGVIRLSHRVFRRELHGERQAGQRDGQGDHHGHGRRGGIERAHRGPRAAPRRTA